MTHHLASTATGGSGTPSPLLSSSSHGAAGTILWSFPHGVCPEVRACVLSRFCRIRLLFRPFGLEPDKCRPPLIQRGTTRPYTLTWAEGGQFREQGRCAGGMSPPRAASAPGARVEKLCRRSLDKLCGPGRACVSSAGIPGPWVSAPPGPRCPPSNRRSVGHGSSTLHAVSPAQRASPSAERRCPPRPSASRPSGFLVSGARISQASGT